MKKTTLSILLLTLGYGSISLAATGHPPDDPGDPCSPNHPGPPPFLPCDRAHPMKGGKHTFGKVPPRRILEGDRTVSAGQHAGVARGSGPAAAARPARGSRDAKRALDAFQSARRGQTHPSAGGGKGHHGIAIQEEGANVKKEKGVEDVE